ncbi:cupin domain-containing protein [Amycolatopsis sp. GM8]|uniref:cupin domain-containing protein n=1 Tax=Amycolatopsis sp. GM8 TaxID=2896530 RepID=UPI001F383DD4|nr:cupin domain-containing protein [Amycolatopsis sp. GM8]
MRSGLMPAGVELYSFAPDGEVTLTDRAGARKLGPDAEFLRFIDDGQFARYFIGDAKTSPERPSNATYKLGIVAPHSAFTPHAHGGEHFVLSLGHAECALYDASVNRAVTLRLGPGEMLRIPELMPHSFANRAGRPLQILTANTGFGIDHDDYAITAEDARARGDEALAEGLGRLGAAPGGTTWRERTATLLRRMAMRLETR